MEGVCNPCYRRHTVKCATRKATVAAVLIAAMADFPPERVGRFLGAAAHLNPDDETSEMVESDAEDDPDTEDEEVGSSAESSGEDSGKEEIEEGWEKEGEWSHCDDCGEWKQLHCTECCGDSICMGCMAPNRRCRMHERLEQALGELEE
eukprot:gene14549-biopygen4502